MRKRQCSAATLEALQRAQQELDRSVRPDTPEERARAEELARQQEAIRRQLLELARRNEERRNSQPLQSLERAGERAQQAQQSLSEGDLDQAQQNEQDPSAKRQPAHGNASPGRAVQNR